MVEFLLEAFGELILEPVCSAIVRIARAITSAAAELAVCVFKRELPLSLDLDVAGHGEGREDEP